MHKIEVLTLTVEQEAHLNALEGAMNEAKRRMMQERHPERFSSTIADYAACKADYHEYMREIGLK